jgi:hypothetical protein
LPNFADFFFFAALLAALDGFTTMLLEDKRVPGRLMEDLPSLDMATITGFGALCDAVLEPYPKFNGNFCFRFGFFGGGFGVNVKLFNFLPVIGDMSLS